MMAARAVPVGWAVRAQLALRVASLAVAVLATRAGLVMRAAAVIRTVAAEPPGSAERSALGLRDVRRLWVVQAVAAGRAVAAWPASVVTVAHAARSAMAATQTPIG